MPPGATELTRIPRVAYSAAAVLVRAMTPLFCEKVVLGGEPQRHAMTELIPSASMPPCCLAMISACPAATHPFADEAAS